jgi:CheY-like chemotaxis protein
MTIRLIGWNDEHTAVRARFLRKAGLDVVAERLDGSNYRVIRKSPPDAFVIDLSRLPSHGREVALALREWKNTRRIPIVFVDGAAEKVARIQRELPDATFAPWSRVRSAIRQAIANPPIEPVRPSARPGGYSGTPLPKKLGIKSDVTVALIDAPSDFEKTLGELPAGARVSRGLKGGGDMVVWFVHERDELRRRVGEIGAAAGSGGVWIAWPKKTSGMKTDVSECDVRESGLDAGLVDFKVCAIDSTWSGLRFAKRKAAQT